MDVAAISASMIAGLGLFLYGLNLMAGGLQKAAGDRMRKVLEVLTDTPLKGLVVGTGVTVIVSSSSATSVMVIGFVNAGLMTLKQAVGVILGANIGTTFSTQLISFDLGAIAPYAIGIGVLMILFGKKKKYKDIGEIVLGFGILFFGMSTMSDAMKPLRSYQPFIDMLASFAAHPILGVLVGAAFTAVIQSSSGTTAIVVALASQGLISLEAALPLVLGSNIGTTVTAALAALKGSLASRRTALAHALFNVGGSILFLFILSPFASVALQTSDLVHRQIANAHTIFNIINAFLLLPFLNPFVNLITKIIPGEDEVRDEFGTIYLDRNFLDNSSIALGQVTRELVRMGKLAGEALDLTVKAVYTEDMKLVEKAAQKEELVNFLEKEIMSYLVEISQLSLTDQQSKRLNYLFECANDIERIGDHSDNIGELAEYKVDNDLEFTEIANEELSEMYSVIKSMISDSLVVMSEYDQAVSRKVYEQEKLADLMEKQLRQSHIQRVSEGKCDSSSGIVFLDMISNFERIADHCNNLSIRAKDL
ncbi:MAG: Na/Pi cotransporter family protein [Clostridia bacterium]